MTQHRFARARPLAAALALAAITLPVSTAHGYGGPGAFDPETKPARFPGTTTSAPAWNLVGSATRDGKHTASHVLVSKRWAIASLHSSTKAGEKLLTLGGDEIPVQAVFTANQRIDPPTGITTKRLLSTEDVADLSLVLLAEDAPTPQGGFPRLLSDYIGKDLAASLPGYVLWSGLGGNAAGGYAPGAVRSGWTKPSGLAVGCTGPVVGANCAVPAPDLVCPVWVSGPDCFGPVHAIDGDSGSAGAWYREAGATPVLASVTSLASGSPDFGRNEAFGAPLHQERLHPNQNTPLYPTVAAWMKAVFAAGPAGAAPAWTTLAAEGAGFDALRPVGPRNIRVLSATPTSLTVGWDHSYETRVPRDKYQVQVSGAPTVWVDGNVDRVTVNGLAQGTTYAATVRGLNANGLSAPLGVVKEQTPLTPPRATHLGEPTSVSYALRAMPVAPTLSVKTRPAATASPAGSAKAQYCVDVTAEHAAPATSGEVRRIEISFLGEAIAADRVVEQNGVARVSLCTTDHPTLDANGHYGVLARTISGATPGNYAFTTASTPVGVPAGTVLPHTTNIVPVGRRAIHGGKAEYCVDVRWDNPQSVLGFPRVATLVSVTDFAVSTPEVRLAASATTHTECGLEPGRGYLARAKVDLTHAVVDNAEWFDVPAGAPRDTVLPGPTTVQTTPVVNAAGSSCARVTWQTPAAVSGFPVAGQVVTLHISGGVTRTTTVGALAQNAEICGLPRGQWFIPTVSSAYTQPVGDAWLVDTYGVVGQTA